MSRSLYLLIYHFKNYKLAPTTPVNFRLVRNCEVNRWLECRYGKPPSWPENTSGLYMVQQKWGIFSHGDVICKTYTGDQFVYYENTYYKNDLLDIKFNCPDCNDNLEHFAEKTYYCNKCKVFYTTKVIGVIEHLTNGQSHVIHNEHIIDTKSSTWTKP